MISLTYWAAALGATVSQLAAQSPPNVPSSETQPPLVAPAATQTAPAVATPVRLHVETPVKITIDETMLSDRVEPGHRFPIYLAEPLVIDGRTVLPSGVRGEGEVIDAKRSSGGGAGGGIVANARYLMCGTTRIALGKMHLGAAGRSSVATATAATAVVGVLGMLVRGHNAQIQQGTLADAKIIADVDVPASC